MQVIVRYIELLVIIIISSGIAFGEEIVIQVDGYSNTTCDGIQLDRKEAVIDAKRQAIERAGVKINSKTIVKNFELLEDFIEAKAKALLLPGFHIVDIGYDTTGTVYKVTLIGNIKIIKDDTSPSLESAKNVEQKVKIKEYRSNDCLSKIIAETIGVNMNKDEITARILAEKQAMKQIKTKLIAILSGTPYNFDVDDAIQIYDKGEILKIEYDLKGEHVSAHVKYRIKVPR